MNFAWFPDQSKFYNTGRYAYFVMTSHIISLQVVYYDQAGHYHAHFDSETHEKTEVPCCHQQEEEKMLSFEHPCRLCRLDFTLQVKYVGHCRSKF